MEAKAIMKADDYYAGFDRGMEVGKKAGIREVVEWMEQEQLRHSGKSLCTAFDTVLRHYRNHKDITIHS